MIGVMLHMEWTFVLPSPHQAAPLEMSSLQYRVGVLVVEESLTH